MKLLRPFQRCLMPAGLIWLRWAKTLLDASVTSLSLSQIKIGLCTRPGYAILEMMQRPRISESSP